MDITQTHAVLDYLVENSQVKRIELHNETGICQNSLGVVLKRLADSNLITKLENGWYETNTYSLMTYIDNLKMIRNALQS